MGFVIFVMFLPWRQNIRAEGEVIAFSPQNRPQEIQSPLAGRIDQWLVQEGDFVEAGQPLVTLTEIKDDYFDPALLDRTREQVVAKEAIIDAKRAKLEAKEKQLAALEEARDFKLEQLENKIVQSELKAAADSASIAVGLVDVQNFNRQLDMFQNLFDTGFVSLVKLEAAQSKEQKAEAELVEKRAKYRVSIQELQNSRIEYLGTGADYLEKIAKAQAEISTTLGEIADSQGELIKLNNKLTNLEVRASLRTITAPQDGYIFNVKKAGLGETVKETSTLMTFVPDNADIAVALYVKAMNLPLIDSGDYVRLQFDGWPAIQFSGWPDISVGTFPGHVQVVDRNIGKKGKYRILVKPDPREDGEEWPEAIRLGSGVYGFVLLNTVPVWYEIWRQINGFPPNIYDEEEKLDKEKSRFKFKVK
jgi:multidrug resistance efflux pump